MEKLSDLTPEENKIMESVKQEYLDYFFKKKMPLNKTQAVEGINWLYSEIGESAPMIIFTDSPQSCQFIVNFLHNSIEENFIPLLERGANAVLGLVNYALVTGKDLRTALIEGLDDRFVNIFEDGVKMIPEKTYGTRIKLSGFEVLPLNKNLFEIVKITSLAPFGATPSKEILDLMAHPDMIKILDRVSEEIIKDNPGVDLSNYKELLLIRLWKETFDADIRELQNNKFTYFSFSNYGSCWDLGWVAFYDFFQRIGKNNHEKFEPFRNLVLSGIYDMIQLKGLCIVSGLPDVINVDREYRLHSEDNMAIHFRDGYELYFWRGRAVPKRWIMDKEGITKADIISETNAERRRCLREIIGNKRFAELLEIVEIDRDHVNNQDVVLYKTKTPDDIINKDIFYVKVTCHSTLREYFMCIPESAATNAWAAVAWTFNKTSEEYRPAFEA